MADHKSVDAEISPPFVFRTIPYQDKQFTLVDDGALLGGSKQRMLIRVMTDIIRKSPTPVTEFVYAGPPFGAAQPALAIAAKRLNVLATVWITRAQDRNQQYYRTEMTKRAVELGADIREINGHLAKVQEAATEYTKMKPGAVLMPFGLYTPEYVQVLAEEFAAAWPIDRSKPARIWVVAGSTTVYAALHAAFPDCNFEIVQVGRTVWPDLILTNTKLHVSDERFDTRARDQPPYQTVATYDAKLWKFVRQSGQHGDYIFNVCSDVPEIANGCQTHSQTESTDALVDALEFAAAQETAIDQFYGREFADVQTFCRELTKFSYRGYPLKRYTCSSQEFSARFAALRDMKWDPLSMIVDAPTIINNIPGFVPKFAGKQQYMKVNESDYEKYDLLSDEFQEIVRVKCRRDDQQQSSYDYYQNNYRRVAETALSKYRKITAHTLREVLYELIYECTSFKPSLMIKFVLMLRQSIEIDRILDISTGWGDRLLAAMALGVEYTGTDPNLNLIPGYLRMIRKYHEKQKDGSIISNYPEDGGSGQDIQYYTMIPRPFQSFDTSHGQYDLVFTSPPYFSLEIYVEADDEISKNQSIGQKTSNVRESSDKWYDDFLMVSLKNALNGLRKGGMLVININDPPAQRDIITRSRDNPAKSHQPESYCIRMIRDMQKICTYIGCLPQSTGPRSGSNRPASAQPFFVFQKTQ